jgi:hypothetical protein
MGNGNSDWVDRRTKVEELCRQLIALVAASRERRETIDRTLAELRSVGQRAQSLLAVRAAASTRSFLAQSSTE